jgi:hypothetical protein
MGWHPNERHKAAPAQPAVSVPAATR